MDIGSIFPELERIDDADLRAGVTAAWRNAAADNERSVADLESVPWFPPAQRELGIAPGEALLVDHVRDVTSCAAALAGALGDGGPDPDLDTVLAGALVHDVSKLYEFDGTDRTGTGRLLGHPHFGVAVVDRAGLPVEIAHIVLSHSGRTTVEPATIEAEIVRRADEVAAAHVRSGAVSDLRDA